jgi:hypothetical protein
MDPVAAIRSVVPAVSPASRDTPQADPAPTRPLTQEGSAQSAASGSRSGRPLAAFLTHLIATAHDAPQTRRHRRAAVGEALCAYAATTVRLEGAPERGALSEVVRAA